MRHRTSPHSRLYNTARWRKGRLAHLEEHPLCKRCSDRGVDTPATVVHHKEPHRGDERLFFDRANWESSCSDCHDVDAQRIENGGRARAEPDSTGWPR